MATKTKSGRGGLDFAAWAEKEHAKAIQSRSVDLHKLIAKYRKAVHKRDSVYDEARVRDADSNEWDAIIDRYDTPIYRMEIQAEKELLRRFDAWDTDIKSRAIMVDGAVVIYPSDEATSKANANTFILLPEEILTIEPDGSALTTMRLTKDEMTIVEAMRAKRGTFRPDVIAGFKSPTNAGELREVIRLMLDCCTPIMATSQGVCEIDIAYEDGADASIVISDEAFGIESASALFRPVEKYRRPTNPAELARTIRSFLENEFGMEIGGLADSDGLEIDLHVEGGSDLVRLEVGREEDFASGDRLTAGDVAAIEAYRAAQATGDTVDVLTPVEAEALTEFREGKDSALAPAEPAFRPVSYNRPRSRDEFADVLAAMVQVDLGMKVVARHDEDEPEPWIYMALDGLDRDTFTDVYLAILKGGGLPTVVNGEGELELLRRYRAKLATLNLDERMRHMLDDYMPEGYTLDLLTSDEATALAGYRAGKGA